MTTVKVDLAERSYEVYIGAGLLGVNHPCFGPVHGRKTLVVSNETVAPLYLDSLVQSLGASEVHTLVLPDGESYKTLQHWSRIIDALVEAGATRDSLVVTLGGGVIGDMGGFAAASYMRGIRFVQVPTSLLAQVDASVGGKTGVNHSKGKNLVGAFHQPASVVIDTDTLDTLPAREYSAGLAEAVKIAAIRDADFLDWLEAHQGAVMRRETEALTYLIRRSVSNKAEIVAEDERESGIRALLNFGHTFAHALETLTGYRQYLHGEAVSIGMMVASRLSESRGLCETGLSERLGRLLTGFNLPVSFPERLATGDVIEAMQLDKKATAGSVRLILVECAGRGVIDSMSSSQQIAEAVDASR